VCLAEKLAPHLLELASVYTRLVHSTSANILVVDGTDLETVLFDG
jgi:hypothetical protein